MSVLKKLTLMTLIVFNCFSVLAEPSFDRDPKFFLAGTAQLWQEARDLCLKNGDSWDLPTVDQALETFGLYEVYNRLLVKDVQSQKLSTFYLVWVRSNEEELNQQLIEQTQLLMMNPSEQVIDSYYLSPRKIIMLKSELKAVEKFMESIKKKESSAEVQSTIQKLKTSIFNLTNEIELLEKGLKVVCIKNS